MTVADVIAEGPDVSRFEDVWERLYEARGCEPSTSFEWTQALLRHHVEAGDRVVLLRLSRGSEPLALVPLVARPVKLFGARLVVLSPIAERYNTHSDLLAHTLDAEAVNAFLSALYRLDLRWDVFRLSKLLEEHELVRGFDAHAARASLTRQLRFGQPSYFLPLPASFDAYLAARSGKFRNHLKRTEKRVDAERPEIVEASDPADVDRAYGMLLEVERGSWKHAHGTAISAIPRQAGFYGDLCRGAAARGRLHLQLLCLAGRPVAHNLGYLRNGSYYYLKTSYVEDCKPLGVSTYLRARLVASLIARGVRHMDFPAEPYEWERQWTDQVRWHKVISIYRSPVGHAVAAADLIRRRLRPGRTLEHVDPRAAHARPHAS